MFSAIVFSTAMRIIKKSTDGEYYQLRLRTSDQKFEGYVLPSDAGNEFRLAILAGLSQEIAYIYIDGELKQTFDMSGI